MKIGYYPRKSHRKLVAIIVAAAVLILLAAGLIIVATRPVFVSGSVDTSYMNRTQPVSFNWPTPGRGAIGTLDGGLEATSGDNKAYPTASLAKLITALVVLQKYPLDGGDGQTLTIGQTDVNFYNQTIADGGSNLPVKLGETLSEKTALSGMLVASADNLADSLASWAFGSLENYRATATTWLKQNGLTGTTIGRDASGLDPGTVSTTTDLFKLGQLTLKNADLKNIVSQTTLAWQGKIVKNTNQLLGQDGYIGVKT
ncbi:MAG: D-alanyl-D-alanine carboxypeptidase, partial [Candidatus Nomurabacteria bacterium]|nr:D-alanyl-D-alanine carboxypeptidase [Candidatus Nomurabacteria bacterium]